MNRSLMVSVRMMAVDSAFASFDVVALSVASLGNEMGRSCGPLFQGPRFKPPTGFYIVTILPLGRINNTSQYFKSFFFYAYS